MVCVSYIFASPVYRHVTLVTFSYLFTHSPPKNSNGLPLVCELTVRFLLTSSLIFRDGGVSATDRELLETSRRQQFHHVHGLLAEVGWLRPHWVKCRQSGRSLWPTVGSCGRRRGPVTGHWRRAGSPYWSMVCLTNYLCGCRTISNRHGRGQVLWARPLRRGHCVCAGHIRRSSSVHRRGEVATRRRSVRKMM